MNNYNTGGGKFGMTPYVQKENKLNRAKFTIIQIPQKLLLVVKFNPRKISTTFRPKAFIQVASHRNTC